VYALCREFEVLESLSLECGVATNQLPQLLAKNAATLRKLRLSGLYLTVDIINVISSMFVQLRVNPHSEGPFLTCVVSWLVSQPWARRARDSQI
jgi:hypothetical protein